MARRPFVLLLVFLSELRMGSMSGVQVRSPKARIVSWGMPARLRDIDNHIINVLADGIEQVASNLCSFVAIGKLNNSLVTWGNTSCNSFEPPPAMFRNHARKVVSTLKAFAVLRKDGRVSSWGSQSYGGNHSTVRNVLLSKRFNVISRTAGDLIGGAFCALEADTGAIVTWGHPLKGGDSSTVSHAIRAEGGALNISSSASSFAAITRNSSVHTWGYRVGGGDSQSVRHLLASEVAKVYANNFAFVALKRNGSVVAWGNFFYGGYIPIDTRRELESSAVVEVYSCSNAFAAVNKQGTIIAWGGVESGDTTSVRAELSGNKTKLKQMFSNTNSFAALMKDGSLVTWGNKDQGGDHHYVSFDAPIKTIVAADNAYAAILENGNVVCWGSQGQGGDAQSVNLNLRNIQTVDASCCAFGAVDRDGRVITWGDTRYGGDSRTVSGKLRLGVDRIFSSYYGMSAIAYLDDDDGDHHSDRENLKMALIMTTTIIGPFVCCVIAFQCWSKRTRAAYERLSSIGYFGGGGGNMRNRENTQDISNIIDSVPYVGIRRQSDSGFEDADDFIRFRS